MGADHHRGWTLGDLGRMWRWRRIRALHEGTCTGKIPNLRELQQERPPSSQPLRSLRTLQEDEPGEEGQEVGHGSEQRPVGNDWYLRFHGSRRRSGIGSFLDEPRAAVRW